MDATPKNKGKVARKVAQNAAICVRYDALHENECQDITEPRLARCGVDKVTASKKAEKIEKLQAFRLNQTAMKATEKVEVEDKGIVHAEEQVPKEERTEVPEKAEEVKVEEKKEPVAEEKKEEEDEKKKEKKEKKEKKDKEHKEHKEHKSHKEDKDGKKKDKEEKKEHKHKDKEEKKEHKHKKDKE